DDTVVKWTRMTGNMNNRYKRISVAPGKGVAGIVKKTGKPWIVEDVNKEIPLSEKYRYPIIINEKIVSFIAIPILKQGMPEGALIIGFRTLGRISKSLMMDYIEDIQPVCKCELGGAFMTKQKDLTQYLQLLYEQSNEIIFFLDREGKIIYRNGASYEIMGDDVQHQLDNALCHHCEGLTDENHLVTCEGCYLYSGANDKVDFQLFMKLQDGTVKPYSANYQTLSYEDDIRVLRLNNISNQMKTQQVLHQKMLTKHIMAAQEDERKRIS